jgi:exonuclease SbcC
LTGDAASLDQLDRIERDIVARREPLEQQLVELDRRLDELADELARAASEKRDRASLERAIALLTTAQEDLNTLSGDEKALVGKRAEADTVRRKIETAEANQPEFERAYSHAAEAAEQAVEAVQRAEEHQRVAAEAIEKLESKLSLAQGAEQRLAGNGKATAPAERLVAQTETRLRKATSAREGTQQELSRLQALEPVAALARACEAGDPCPVCHRALPEDFEPPAVGEALEAAAAVHGEAMEAEDRARSDHSEAVATLKQLLDARPALERESAEAARDLAEASDSLRAVVDDLKGFEGNALLERAHKLSADAENELPEQRKRRDAHLSERDRLKADLDQLASTIKADKQLFESADRANADEQQRIERERRRVRERLEKLAAPFELSDEPDGAEIAGALEQLGELLPGANELESEQASLVQSKQKIADQLAELERELQREVRQPAIGARATLDGIRQELERMSAPRLPAPPPVDAPARELAAWGEAIEKALAEELKSQRKHADQLREQARRKRQGALARIKELGVADKDEFDRHRITLGSALMLARQQLEQAEAHTEPAEPLDDLRKRTEAMRAALDDLYDLLLPGHFIGYAVGNRQRALLAAASLVLKEITGGQFGFSDDFRIVDNETGQSRAPQTLSGGEQFLASLSLALGLLPVATQ